MAGFAHEQVWRVLDLTGERAALGGAVTVGLCGHWEHEGSCRWPHHTSVEPAGGSCLVTVAFDAPAAELQVVRQRIHDALATGRLTGPDGTETTWLLAD